MMVARNERELDETLVALADPTRRAILRQLMCAREERVTTLAERFPISLNSVSKHIRLLERAGMVSRRKVGREHLLSFRPEPFEKVRKWILAQEAFWKAGLETLDSILSKSPDPPEAGGPRSR